MNYPLLSVVVPCYNVEKYLDKCIVSIVEQTYPNLEILLIDDGSPDNSGAICDTWQERDSRIRVIHKQNEGSSYARKTGVEIATAEYITFVDSDDWIDRNMYSDMMTALLSTNSDIVQCDFCIVHEDGRIEHRVQERNTTVETMGRVEGVIMILEDHDWRTSMFTKIFKKKLFEHVEFPKGRAYGEDMIETHRTFYAEMLNQLDSIKEIRTYGIEQDQADLFERFNRKTHDVTILFTKLYANPQALLSIGASALIGVIFLISVVFLQTDTARLVVLVYIFSRLWQIGRAHV